jgi:hypothetical protein
VNIRRRHTNRIELVVAALELPDPFDIDVFVQMVAEQRQRRMIVVDEPALGSREDNVCGLWVKYPAFDVLHIRARLAPLHREATILHEIGHVLLDHSTTDRSSALATLFPSLAASGALSLYARSRYSDPPELEAETFARALLARVGRYTPRVDPVQPAAPADIASVLHRLEAMFDPSESDH